MSSDSYRGTNVGAMGRNAKAEKVVFKQDSRGASALDFESIVRELERVRVEARKRASEPEHDDAVASLGRAEAAAKAADSAGTLSYLKKAGSWGARIATELSASIVAKLIETQLE